MKKENGSLKYEVKIAKSDQNSSQGKILAEIKPNSKVLECGCATGYMTKWMKEELRCKVSVIEIDEVGFEAAKAYAEDGFCGDLNREEWISFFDGQQFDYILFADVLEHLSDPLKVLTRANGLLKNTGKIIISIPNIAHNDVILKLIDNSFDYTETGLLDSTHLHFWGRNNLEEFCLKAGLNIVQIDGTVIPFQKTEQARGSYDDADCRITGGLADRALGEIYQYVFVCQKTEYVKKRKITCVNLLPEKKGDSFFRTGRNVDVCSDVYFSDGSGFAQENGRTFVRSLNTALPGEINICTEIPENCTSVRFDPCEGVFCLVSEPDIEYAGRKVSFECVNGTPVGTAYLFADKDPQFIFTVPQTEGEERILNIRCRLTVFEADREKEITEFTKQLHERSVLIGQLETLNSQLNSVRTEIAGMRDRRREIISSSVFFETAEGFSEENAIVLNREIDKDEESALPLHFDVKVPAGCGKVRIDPCEGKYCVACNVQIIYDGKKLSGNPAEGFIADDMVFFRGEDPKFIVELPDADGRMLHVDMMLRLFDVRDLTMETLNRQLQEDVEKIDTLSQIIVDTNQNHIRETAELREEMEELRSSWEEKYRNLQQSTGEELEEKDRLMEEAGRNMDEAAALIDDQAAQIASLKAQIENLNTQMQSQQASGQQMAERASRAEENYAVVSNSFFWKITKPGRAVMDGIKSVARKNERVYKGLRFVKWTFRYGPKGAVRRKREFDAMQAQIAQAAAVQPAPVQRSLSVESDIKISILVPLYNTPEQFLREMIESVTGQTYGNWQLCLADASDAEHGYVESVCRQYADADGRISYKKLEKNLMISGNSNAAAEMADGDYIGLLDHDDLLSPFALEQNIIAISEKHADVLYSDEDHLLLNGQHGNPFYKPDWSPDLLNTQMYICHFLVFRRSLFREVGGFRSDFDGSQDYDLMLRLSEKTNNITHIPQILYSWRESPSSTALNADSKPYAQTAGLRAVDEHLHRKYGDKAFAQETENLFVYDARYPLPDDTKITIVIPMKDNWKLTDACIRSIVEKSTWKNYEILVLDNRSEEAKTFRWFKSIVNLSPAIRVLKADMEFNWSKINNFGIRNGNGDVFIFLNNDTVVISPDWMERLAEKALRKDTGVVGPLLLYEDGTIQHAGVVVGFGGWADHVFKGMPPVHFGAPYVSPMVTRNVLAVTGACMAVSKATLEKIGVFDETFIICGSDVELGIRAYERGLFNVYDASVRLYHLESKSRDSYIPNQDYKRSYEVYTPYREGGDPFYNPNLDKNSTTPKIAEIPAASPAEVNPDATEQDGSGDDEEMKALGRIKEALKTNPLTKGAYAAARNKVQAAVESMRTPSSSVAEVQPIRARRDDVQRKRLNLLTPSVDVKHVFGGIATALKFFEQLCEKTGWEARIISVDAPVVKDTSVLSSRYVIVNSSTDSEEPYQVVPFNDRASATIPVRKTDVFMATGWWTAYTIKDVLLWQKETWETENANPLIYLVQDFEPGFYPWSSRYLMADSTYRMQTPVYAVFNAKLLKEFFDKQGYSFTKSWYFDPVMNEKLVEYLPAGLTAQKKKQIIIYGRPGTPRNAFELACMSLREFIAMDPANKDWTFISAGEEHCDIDLGSGAVLRSVGKLSLQDYAGLMTETYAGISLMVSPHPSYPPLEMSSFGVKTITNCLYNKDLSSFSGCITSLKNCSANEIAGQLNRICADYTPDVHWEINEDYVKGTDPFGEVIGELSSILKD
ncbi:MAG: glycosyltransferase [Lachnospiraceae bacterium]|nr:glycosyltransferase [Lachnospiraceae bacterium]